MSEPFLSEIRIFSFDFPPKGWTFCNGQILPINQNQALFSLLGTTYGGDGRVNFALPNLQGRCPLHMGNGHVLGESAGEQNHTLVTGELPSHNHTARCSTASGNQAGPANNIWAVDPTFATTAYAAPPPALQPMAPQALGPAGGTQPHSNMQPFLTLTFCIALQGIFPSRN